MKTLINILAALTLIVLINSSCSRGGCGCSADLNIPFKDSNAILFGPDGESIFLGSGNGFRSVCNLEIISQEIKDKLKNNANGISINVDGLIGRTCSGKMQPAITPSGIRIISFTEN